MVNSRMPEGFSRTNLLAELILNVTLDTPQHEWLQNHVQPSELMLVKPATLVLCSVFNVLREPLVELVVRVEQAWHDKVQQCPQLLHGVLDGGSGKEQTITAIEPKERFPSRTGRILDVLGFVQDHVLPLLALEVLLILSYL